MGTDRPRWLMLRQCPTKGRAETISHLPVAWMIRGENPHALLGLLGLGVGRHTFPGTSLFDLGGLGAQVKDERRRWRASPLHLEPWWILAVWKFRPSTNRSGHEHR